MKKKKEKNNFTPLETNALNPELFLYPSVSNLTVITLSTSISTDVEFARHNFCSNLALLSSVKALPE